MRQIKSLAFKGFTLIELIIAVAIFIAVGYMLALILIQNNNIFFNQNAQVTQGLGLNQTSLSINEAVKQAVSISAASPTIPIYTSNSNSLVLVVPSLDLSGNAIVNTTDYLVITKDSSNPTILRYIVFPTLPQSHRQAENRVLLKSLSTITFIYQDQAGNSVTPTSASRISYTVIVSEKAGLSTRQSQTSSVVNLRNN